MSCSIGTVKKLLKNMPVGYIDEVNDYLTKLGYAPVIASNTKEPEIIQFSVKDRGKKLSTSSLSKPATIDIINSISPEASSLLKSGSLSVVNSEKIKELIDQDKDSMLSIIGESARTARNLKLDKAKSMMESGKSIEEIKANTGWYIEKDGKWRYVLKTVPKFLMTEETILDDLKYGNTIRVKDVVNYPELFEAYPYIANTVIAGDPTIKGGYYRAGTLYVGTNKSSYDTAVTDEDIDLLSGIGLNMENSIFNTIGHEVQHLIQHVEGMTNGSNLEAATNTQDFRDAEKASNELKDVAQEFADRYPELVKLIKDNIGNDKIINSIQDKVVSGFNSVLQGITGNVRSKEFIDRYVKNGSFLLTGSQLAKLTYLKVLGEVDARKAGDIWSGNTPTDMPYITEGSVSNDISLIPTSLIQGVFTKGKAYINYEAMETPNQVKAVVYHEVGVHAFVDMFRNDPTVQKYMENARNLMERGINSNDLKVKEFFVEVQHRLVASGSLNSNEEILAYMVEHAINTLKEDKLFGEKEITKAINDANEKLPGIITSLLKKILELFKQSYSRLGEELKKSSNKELQEVGNNIDISISLDKLVEFAKGGIYAVSESSNGDKVDNMLKLLGVEESNTNGIVIESNSLYASLLEELNNIKEC